jgi:hypothetical protein
MDRSIGALVPLATLAFGEPARADTVSATNLFDAYARNEIVAEDSYNGRHISIGGRVKTIKKATFGAPIVVLDAGSPDRSVSCHFPKKFWPQIEQASAGDDVVFSCTVKYRMGDTIHASACRPR